MRPLLLAALILGVAGSAAWAKVEPAPAAAARPPAEAAPAAQRYATPAAATARSAPPHGYSADARRVADCLATYPGYDLRTDRIPVRPGVTRPCPL